MRRKLLSYIILTSFLTTVFVIGKDSTSFPSISTTGNTTSRITIITSAIGFDIIAVSCLFILAVVIKLRSKRNNNK